MYQALPSVGGSAFHHVIMDSIQPGLHGWGMTHLSDVVLDIVYVHLKKNLN